MWALYRSVSEVLYLAIRFKSYFIPPSQYIRLLWNSEGIKLQLIAIKWIRYHVSSCWNRIAQMWSPSGVCPIIGLCVRLISVRSKKSQWPSSKVFAHRTLVDIRSVLAIRSFSNLLAFCCCFLFAVLFFLLICLLELALALFCLFFKWCGSGGAGQSL